MFKRVLIWGGIAFLVFFVAYRPSSAADVFAGLGSTVSDIAQGFGDFFRGIVS